MKKIIGGLVLMSLLFSNCSSKQKISEAKTIEKNNLSKALDTAKKKQPSESSPFKIRGIVLDRSIVGGCDFVISVNDSTTFEPINLGKEFQKDSIKIIFDYKLSRAMTTCMMGQPIVLSKVKLINQKTE